ncbi:hypothetical protein V7075_08990 [Neobacillus drentensis]|uniref:hypothetical protein n=1 Tax=Neobacillus drentensis TaxID=220684 RepID=UPI002FFDE6D3
MSTSPVPSPKLHFFSYKSAFIFFSFILVFNLIFTPLLTVLGVDQQLALYLINTIAISVGLTGVIVLIEGKCKTKKQAAALLLSLFIGCLLVCYVIVFQ